MRRRNYLISSLSVTIVACLLLPLPLVVARAEKCHRYKHLLVLVHGYLGSHREQSYLGETFQNKAASLNNTSYCQQHEFVVHLAKSNNEDTTDGVEKGGHRLANEVLILVELQSRKSQDYDILTLSFVGNSLGGLFSRYAVGEIFANEDYTPPNVLPLIFATTSSPHLGVSRETFVPLSRWAEELLGHAMAQTGRDMFLIDPVITDMCTHPNYLQALQQFQKRIAVANAYNTDFLVSVRSGAFLEEKSNSVHHNSSKDSDNQYLMGNEHVVLQVKTPQSDDSTSDSGCGSNLDRLGWHKIFLDTRSALPSWLNIQDNIPPLPNQSAYKSGELQDLFARYGTMFPIAHPLNMANSKTDWYSALTKEGRPIMDALADLLIHDMMHFSESYMQQQSQPDPDEKDQTESESSFEEDWKDASEGNAGDQSESDYQTAEEDGESNEHSEREEL